MPEPRPIEPIIVFRYLDKRQHQPFKVVGRNVKTGISAKYEEKYRCHVFRMSLSEYRKVADDLARGSHLPMCLFVPWDVEGVDASVREMRLETDLALIAGTIGRQTEELEAAKAEIERLKQLLSGAEEAKLLALPQNRAPFGSPKAIEDMTFRELNAFAKDIGLPRFSIYARSGRKEPLIDAIRAFILKGPDENVPSENSAGDQASTQGNSEAAAA